jgi:hypothetical protein
VREDGVGDIFVHEGDVFAFLEQVEDESVDGVITDLPWPTQERHRARGTTTRTKASNASSNPWYPVMLVEDLSRVLDELYRVCRPGAYLFAYCDGDTEALLRDMRGVNEDLRSLTPIGFELDDAGAWQPVFPAGRAPTSRAPRDAAGWHWRPSSDWGKTTLDSEPLQDWYERHFGKLMQANMVQPLPARWNDHLVVKLNPGTGYHGARCTDRILVLSKGDARADVNWRSLLLAPRPQAKPAGATLKASSPKPARNAEILARAISNTGDALILDPFVGCGEHAVGIAASGNDALVNDIDLTVARDWWANVHAVEVNEW